MHIAKMIIHVEVLQSFQIAVVFMTFAQYISLEVLYG